MALKHHLCISNVFLAFARIFDVIRLPLNTSDDHLRFQHKQLVSLRNKVQPAHAWRHAACLH